MKVCLQVTIALDIFIKEKNNTSYLPWISALSFFYAKAVYLVRLSGEIPYSLFSNPPDIPTLPSPTPTPPAYYILHKFPSPSLFPCLLEPPRLFGTLEYSLIFSILVSICYC